MSAWLDLLSVALLVAASAAYAALSLGPRDWRRRGYAAVAALAGRLHRLPGAAALGASCARRALALAARGGGCGGCGSCGDTPPAGGAGETRVAISRIGRRR